MSIQICEKLNNNMSVGAIADKNRNKSGTRSVVKCELSKILT